MYETSKGGKRITPSQAVDLINNKEAIFVDIREKDNFDSGHIHGSINVQKDISLFIFSIPDNFFKYSI